jgi:hypothetical protein
MVPMIECTRCLLTHEEEEEECPNPALERLLLVNQDYEPAHSNPTPTKTKIAQLLQCPINWRDLAPTGSGVIEEFEFQWQLIATQSLRPGTGDFGGLIVESRGPGPDPPSDYYEHISDHERSDLKEIVKKLGEAYGESFEVYFSPVTLEIEDEEDLREELPEIEKWIARSREVYLKKMHRFEKMVLADDAEYRKHFRPPNEPQAKTRELSGKGKRISYFYKSITPDKLRILRWDILWDCWPRLLNASHAKEYVNAGIVVGASNGKDTTHVVFVIDLSTPRIHAYQLPKTRSHRASMRSIPPRYEVDIWQLTVTKIPYSSQFMILALRGIIPASEV